jgi:aspartate aminotransferase
MRETTDGLDGDAVDRADRRLSRRARNVEGSPIREMFELAQSHPDRDLVSFEIGEPDFDTPQHVIDAAYEAASDGATHYTPTAGLPALRSAIAEKAERDNDLSVDPETQVAVTTGGMEALLLAVLSVVDPGEEVLVPTPGWPNYDSHAALAEAELVEVPLSAARGFDLDPGVIADRITDDTAAVMLNSPSNPTGRVFDEGARAEVVEAAAEHDAYVVADEVYEGLTYEGSRRATAAISDHPEQVLTVSSVSKTFAMTGWRLGWIIGPEDVIDAVIRVHEATTACPSSIAQHAALEAINGPQDEFERMRSQFRNRRAYVLDRVAGIDGLSCPEPEGGFYVFLNVSTLSGSSLEIAKRLFFDYGVVTAPGEGFGDFEGTYLRLSYANSMDRIEEGFDRIAAMIREEKGR